MAEGRVKMRKEVDPQGPIGHLLESIHLQGAGLDLRFNIKKWSEADIEIKYEPYQILAELVQELCCRNRTRAAQGGRAETVNLKEIDQTATIARVHENLVILDIYKKS